MTYRNDSHWRLTEVDQGLAGRSVARRRQLSLGELDLYRVEGCLSACYSTEGDVDLY